MTAEAMALLIASCGLSLPPGINAERLATIAIVESGGNPRAVSQPNRNGTRDYGLFQISSSNHARFGVNERTVMEPCTNLRIGVAILAEADRAAACIYNAGEKRCRSGFDNGYPDKIRAAAARVAVAERAAAARPSAPAPEPSFDVWAEPAPAADPETPDGEEDAAPAGQQPRVIAENE